MADLRPMLILLLFGALVLAVVWGLGVVLLVTGLRRKRPFLAVAGSALVCLSLVGTLGWVLVFIR
jgi:hypothetical protein